MEVLTNRKELTEKLGAVRVSEAMGKEFLKLPNNEQVALTETQAIELGIFQENDESL